MREIAWNDMRDVMRDVKWDVMLNVMRHVERGIVRGNLLTVLWDVVRCMMCDDILAIV